MSERAETTLGRHAARDDEGVHPLVAAALSRRPASSAPDAPRHGGPAVALSAVEEGEIGWPGEPADGTGLGWPVDQPAGTATAVERQTVAPVRRRGWRRFFGTAAA
jgi:hypothetical protein